MDLSKSYTPALTDELDRINEYIDNNYFDERHPLYSGSVIADMELHFTVSSETAHTHTINSQTGFTPVGLAEQFPDIIPLNSDHHHHADFDGHAPVVVIERNEAGDFSAAPVDNQIRRTKSDMPIKKGVRQAPRTSSSGNSPLPTSAPISGRVPTGLMTLMGHASTDVDPGLQHVSPLNLDLTSSSFRRVFEWLTPLYISGSTQSLKDAIISVCEGHEQHAQTSPEYTSVLVGMFLERLRLLMVHQNLKGIPFGKFMRDQQLPTRPSPALIPNLPSMVMRTGVRCQKLFLMNSLIIDILRDGLTPGNITATLDDVHLERFVQMCFMYYVCMRCFEFLSELGGMGQIRAEHLDVMRSALGIFSKKLTQALTAVSGLKKTKKLALSRDKQHTPSPSPDTPGPSPVEEDGKARVDENRFIQTTEGLVSVYNISGRPRNKSFSESSTAKWALEAFADLDVPVESFRLASCVVFSRYIGPEFWSRYAQQYRLMFRHLLVKSIDEKSATVFDTIPGNPGQPLAPTELHESMEYHELMPVDINSLVSKVVRRGPSGEFQQLPDSIVCLKNYGLGLMQSLTTLMKLKLPRQFASFSASGPSPDKDPAEDEEDEAPLPVVKPRRKKRSKSYFTERWLSKHKEVAHPAEVLPVAAVKEHESEFITDDES